MPLSVNLRSPFSPHPRAGGAVGGTMIWCENNSSLDPDTRIITYDPVADTLKAFSVTAPTGYPLKYCIGGEVYDDSVWVGYTDSTSPGTGNFVLTRYWADGSYQHYPCPYSTGLAWVRHIGSGVMLVVQHRTGVLVTYSTRQLDVSTGTWSSTASVVGSPMEPAVDIANNRLVVPSAHTGSSLFHLYTLGLTSLSSPSAGAVANSFAQVARIGAVSYWAASGSVVGINTSTDTPISAIPSITMGVGLAAGPDNYLYSHYSAGKAVRGLRPTDGATFSAPDTWTGAASESFRNAWLSGYFVSAARAP